MTYYSKNIQLLSERVNNVQHRKGWISNEESVGESTDVRVIWAKLPGVVRKLEGMLAHDMSSDYFQWVGYLPITWKKLNRDVQQFNRGLDRILGA